MSTATTSPAVPRILPEGIYDDALLYEVLGMTPQVLKAARRAGELRSVRKGTRTLYLGEWVLDWLKQEEAGAAEMK
jgi:hypothetical protein